jgi:hypothetical protein
MKLWKEFLETNSIKEDAPANFAGGMTTTNIDGLGTGEKGAGVKLDGRTGPYRRHRKKLEDARQKREERKLAKEQKFADDIQNKNLHMSVPAAASGIIPDTALLMPAMNKKLPFKNSKT